ncbi:hypothetical protein PYCCODRAFT_1439892 [Trametes coccinea BRFM310]|uniref:Uncharacterized protein n=1 Tax=Trametes coccinea (strain BRFM310) TaxID=1353009 RepID=A0A1Y2IBK0_TRAC3|nr:hypothetical protein PYCCODRAFT_1439892 [Trametes coccinea BRFM310]
MNTVKSTLLGWGALIVGAGGSYYAARKWVNQRRAMQEARGERSSEKLDWRSKIEREEKVHQHQHTSASSSAVAASSGAPPSTSSASHTDGPSSLDGKPS